MFKYEVRAQFGLASIRATSSTPYSEYRDNFFINIEYHSRGPNSVTRIHPLTIVLSW
jgi:hypothetical protein